MDDVGGWLRRLGLEQYEAAFRENKIDDTVLPSLTVEDLKDLGVGFVGHRRKLLDAIAALRAEASEPAPQSDAALKDTAERRQVTVMFSDLVGSTALSARLDPEDLREVIAAYQRCVAEIVRRFGGFVAKYMGDGVLVYFGYPAAHEDDAERAVRAGLELIVAVAMLKAPVLLQIRVGIATGVVVVGDLIGSGEAQERGIVGETPNLAARLQTVAAPNMVVVSDGTRRLLGNLFELQELEARSLKGISGSVRAWAVLRPSSVESRFEALHPTELSALVGREEETELLSRRWSRAKAGEGQVVLISGEAGIGKSRLAAAMLESLTGEPHICLRYFCSPYHQDSALYPSIAQLERAAGFRRDDTDAQRLDKLEAVLAQATDDISQAVPLMASLLSIPTVDRYAPLDLTPQKRKQKTLQTQLAQVEGLAMRGPVLMVFEDLHWSDPTTRESLDLLIDRVASLRVLLILTFRPEFAPSWVGRPHVALLSLSRLLPRERAQVILQVTRDKPLPKEISDEIIDRTDGVPLFIEELTKAVVESGMLTDVGDRYTTRGPVAPLAIPTSLQASLLARLDRLAPTREVAQIAAALGRNFSHELISAVAAMPNEQLDDALAQLVHAELVFRRGTPPDAEYTFKHALVQDAAYSTLLRGRRQQLHGKIVAALEDQFPEVVETQPGLLAQHCAEAGLLTKATTYWLRAGQMAAAQSANAEAVSHLTKALDLLRTWPDPNARDRLELEVQINLGPALIALKGYAAPDTVAVYERARELIHTTGDRTQQDIVLTGVFVCYYNLAAYERSLEVGQEFLQSAIDVSEAVPLCIGHRMLAVSYNTLGRFGEAKHHAEQALCNYDPALHSILAWRYGHDLGVAAMCHRAIALWHLGFPDQSAATERQALTLAVKLNHHNTTGYALFYAGVLSAFRHREMVPLASFVERVIAHGRQHGLPQWVAWGSFFQAPSLTGAGRADQAIATIDEALTAADRMQNRVYRPIVDGMLAEARLAQGNSRAALELIGDALAIAERSREQWMGSELWRIKGNVLAAIGDPNEAEVSFRSGIKLARRQGSRMFELRCAASLARLLRDQGKRDEARELLVPIYGWFTEGFDTLDLKQAKALLDELAA